MREFNIVLISTFKMLLLHILIGKKITEKMLNIENSGIVTDCVTEIDFYH